MKKTKLGLIMESIVTKGGFFIAKHPILFYILNFTWGLPLTLLGLILTVILLPWKLKIHKYNYIYGVQTVLFSKGHYWGFEMGTCFFTSIGGWSFDTIKDHEFGHTCQNALLGPFQILLVWLPSIFRFWYRELMTKYNKPLKTKYNDIWFEKSASEIGAKYSLYKYF